MSGRHVMGLPAWTQVLALTSLQAARIQMAVSLGFHIVFAALGVGLPLLLLIAEYRANRTRDATWMALARRWAKGLAILFAVGAVSGTVLSFALGLFWPGLMGRWGSVIGLPFALEAFAFFIEAIFLGIYLYGWDRLTPWQHWWSGVPIAIAGAASAWFVVTANAWMQTPQGFRELGGRLVEVDPIRAMLNPSTPVMTTHMIVAAYMATGLGVAAVYAVAVLKGRRDEYHRRGLAVGLAIGLGLAPVQIFVGDWAADVVAHHQPVKLASLEGQWETQRQAPLRIGGLPDPSREETRFAIEIPGGLSWLAYGDVDAIVRGLKDVPVDDRPNTVLVHLAFQAMVAIGFGLLGLGLWAAVVAVRRRRLPDSRWFLRAAVVAGPAAFIAIEAGWIVTEVGRQPWIVQGVMRTSEAVTSRPGIVVHLIGTIAVYLALGAACAYLLLRLARQPRGAQEQVAGEAR
ncbi:MAG TPA: cytochrome ubiquinol oxidase subunit I [Actinomycetota bacterium]|jgi:cytochrome d ubiquinol oxidase subunit I|nr:cytochrome ubiquinol oxidase subunit I [Actinomycetota bacterium]